jgi:hypothetical protein
MEKSQNLSVTRNSVEENRAVIRECVAANEEFALLRESIQARLGFDITDKNAFPVENRRFSWQKAKRELAVTFKEADSASSFVQLLRAGIQTMVNGMYETVPTTYEEWAHVVQSTKDTELYAPLQGISFPSEVGRQEAYGESAAAGLDLKLSNRKYGQLFAVEEELLSDDQTGEFQKQAKLLGQYLKLVNEVLAYGKLGGVKSQYSNLIVPASETKPSYEGSWPYSTAMKGGGANRPASFAAFTQASIQNGFIALMNQLNILGLKMAVQPNRLIIGPKYKFDAAVLLHSGYYPSGAAAAGSTGGAFAVNPIEGIAQLTVSRFMFDQSGKADGSSKAWYLMDDSVPAFLVQIREAASVVQEAANAGAAFERDVIRFKGRTRCNADFIEPRFFYQGSDGSV